MIITIDGPSASGKGTLAQNLANHYGYYYIDSGLIYRYLAYICVNQQITITEEAAAKLVANIPLAIKDQNIFRAPHISSISSEVAVFPKVRERIKDYIHKIAHEQLAKDSGIVIDGRDCGSSLFPQADIKIYLTADLMVRAKRRYKELLERHNLVTLDEVYADMKDRDVRDMTRKVSPLTKPEDALEIISDNLNEKDVLKKVVETLKDMGL